MFLNQIRDFFIKSNVKKKFHNVLPDFKSDTIKKVGLIIDESEFNKREALLNKMVTIGFTASEISILLYKDKIYKNEIFDKPSFSNSDLSWSGNFNNPEVNYFVDQKFDLLINYYDCEKLQLLLVSNNSKALFKVGFSKIDKRINHFMIATTSDKFEVFVDELFKYLKILKKIGFV